MKPRLAIPLSLALAAIAVLGYLIISDQGLSKARQDAISSDGPREREIARPTVPVASAARETSGQTDTKKLKDADWQKILGLLQSGGVPPVLDNATIERFLAENGETPANLLAASMCTQNPAWLDRALERFPGNPMLLLAKLGKASPKDLDPDLVRRFNEAAPENPLAKIFEAQSLFNGGDKESALAAVKEAMMRPGFYTWMNETTEASRAIYEFSGMSPLAADLMSTMQFPLPHLHISMGVSKGLSEAYKESVTAGQPDQSILQATYEMGRMFSTPEASRTLIGQLVGASIERRALESLAPGEKPEWLPATPSVRIAELEAKKASIPVLTKETDWLMTQNNPVLLSQYLKRFRTEGETSAMTWLGEQRIKASNAAAKPR